MRAPPKKLGKTGVDDLPMHVWSTILARVANDSITDVLKAKLSCKMMKEVCDDSYVYSNANLMELETWLPWRRGSDQDRKNVRAFLTRCEESSNPETFIRRSLCALFGGAEFASEEDRHRGRHELAMKCLEKAIALGSLEARYVASIAMVFAGDEQVKTEGIKSLAELKRCRTGMNKIQEFRKKTASFLRVVTWRGNGCRKRVESPRLRCGKRHTRVNKWALEEDELVACCDICSANVDIDAFSSF